MNVMYLPVVDVYDGDTIFVKFTLPTPLATVAAITNDTSTWNGSADHSQRLRITATPDHEGPVFGWVYYAKRGASVPVCHVDPQIVISAA